MAAAQPELGRSGAGRAGFRNGVASEGRNRSAEGRERGQRAIAKVRAFDEAKREHDGHLPGPFQCRLTSRMLEPKLAKRD
jgi:hypothetical protein